MSPPLFYTCTFFSDGYFKRNELHFCTLPPVDRLDLVFLISFVQLENSHFQPSLLKANCCQDKNENTSIYRRQTKPSISTCRSLRLYRGEIHTDTHTDKHTNPPSHCQRERGGRHIYRTTTIKTTLRTTIRTTHKAHYVPHIVAHIGAHIGAVAHIVAAAHIGVHIVAHIGAHIGAVAQVVAAAHIVAVEPFN